MIYIFYRPNTDYERGVMEFKDVLDKRRLAVELVDLNTHAGTTKAEAYVLMQFPSVLVTREPAGEVIQSWAGTLPPLSDVEFHARSEV